MSKPLKQFGFHRENYKLLLIGLAINIIGFILMIGGGTSDPNKFNGAELFNNTRITIAPLFIVVGYIVIIFSIMKKGKPTESGEKNPLDTTKK